LTHYEALSLKLIEHCDENRRIAWTGGKAAKAISPSRLLSHRGARPCDTRARKCDELAPPHLNPSLTEPVREAIIFLSCAQAIWSISARAKPTEDKKAEKKVPENQGLFSHLDVENRPTTSTAQTGFRGIRRPFWLDESSAANKTVSRLRHACHRATWE
jgi:hypothetical protein